MKPDSARALVWVSLFLVVIGPIATSRAANFMGPALAALLALLPAVFGRGRTRLLASIVLAASVAAAAIMYPGYRAEMERWMARSGADTVSSERPVSK